MPLPNRMLKKSAGAKKIAAQVALYCAHRTSTFSFLSMALPISFASLSWKDTHVGLRAAVERGPSQGARSGSTGPTWVFFRLPNRARSASKKGTWPLPSLSLSLQGWELIDLPLRASNARTRSQPYRLRPIAVGFLSFASVKACAKSVAPNGVTVSPTQSMPCELPTARIACAPAIMPNSIGQDQTAQDDRRVGGQWARNIFDPSLRLGRR